MSFFDFAVLAVLFVLALFAIRYCRKHPGCGGTCEGCSHRCCRGKPGPGGEPPAQP